MIAKTAAVASARTAADALEHRLVRGGGYAVDVLVEDQQRLSDAIGSLVRRMNAPDLTGRDLDRVARAVGDLLALAEDLRRVRARTTARLDGDRAGWRRRLAID